MDQAPLDRAPLRRDERHPRSRSRPPPPSSAAAAHHHPPPPLHVWPRDPRARDPRLRPYASDRDQAIRLQHPQQQQYRHDHPLVPLSHAAPSPLAPIARKALSEASNATEPRFRHDPAYREKLMRTEVVPLDELKRLRALKVKGDKSEDGVVPIPVPLEPGETEREYEEALNEWLRKRGTFLKDLHDDPFRERSFRIAYANLRVRANDKPRSNSSEHSRDYDAEGWRGRGGESHARKRSGSLEDYGRPPHKVHVTSHPHSNSSSSIRTGSSSRDHRYDGDSSRPRHDHPHRPVLPTRSSHGGRSASNSRSRPYDDDSRRPRDSQRSVSPTRSSLESSSKRCKAHLPASNASSRSFVSAYVKCYCFDCLCDWNLMLTERLEVLETEVRDLRMRVPEIDEAVDEKGKRKERSPKVVKSSCKDPRTKANINGESQEKTTSEVAIARPSDAPKASSTPKSIPSPVEAKLSTQKSEMNQQLDATVASSEPSSLSHTSQSNDSSTQPKLSGDSQSAETFSNAVQRAEGTSIETTSTSEAGPANSDEVQAASLAESQGKLGNAESSARYHDNPAQTEPVHAEELLDAPIATDSTAEMLAIEQSVKAQMTEEYDSLNKQILINERVLQDAVEQIQRKMATDMAGALQEQEQIHQLRQSVVEEMVNRDAALAMVIAYCWMGKHAELMDRITQLDALDVPHVQRVGHVKCAELATRIAEKSLQLSTLKAQVAGGSVPNGGTQDSQVVNDLKSQIAQAETALASSEEERMEQFMRLFQFSTRIRALCKSMLEEKG